MRREIAIAGVLIAAGPAHAERRTHGSAGGGGALLLTGERGDRTRFDVAVDLKLGGRFGAGLAWRAFDAEHRGLVLGGLVFEAGAARPRLVIDLHADLGADLDSRAPVAGGGVRTTIALVGPLGIALDLGAYLVIDGLDDTRLQIQSNALAVLRW